MNSSDSNMYLRDMRWEGKQVILHTDGLLCMTPGEVVRSRAFEKVLNRYLDFLESHDDPILKGLAGAYGRSEERRILLSLLRALAEAPLEYAVRSIPGTEACLENPRPLYLLVETMYDFWRSHNRYLVSHSERGPLSQDKKPYRTFHATVERLNDITRALYRDICENITGKHLRIYRQLHAGCNVGLIAVREKYPLPEAAERLLKEVPVVRQILINPPLIMDPPENRRTGQFIRADRSPLEGLEIKSEEWLCYPAQVGPVVIFVYFHQRFTGLGASLANLFELASDEQLASGPDAIYLYGADPAHMASYGDLPTVFYDDDETGLLVGAVPGEDRFGYFGYLKKMMLTLHNIRMMKTGRMPFHGALARISLRGSATATLLLIGETATGKSETLEALRTLGKDKVSRMSIIADDMGSIEVTGDGRIVGYGTETGAFIRLDDLEHGYAFDQVDRAIIMSPQKVNARVVLPVAFIEDILSGQEIDMILYANNYEEVDQDHQVIQALPEAREALAVFREGAAMAKGTTTSTGLTHSYFANIFGPPQYRELHDALAARVFDAAYGKGLFIGQVRTRLAVPGFEREGPMEAAMALLDLVSGKRG
ncbi:MAG: phosphoenolpyruvate carboxykinase [bacterium]|nr:MAG: phosphoenolpyruvate carboxykinase [bacterium]